MAALVRRFGVDRLELLESCVQEAALRAVERWREELEVGQVESWLVRVAHNAIIDQLRRERRTAPLEDGLLEGHPGASTLPPTPELDDELRLMFLCCHPVLPRAAQIALTLRIAYGFSTEQIARAFLSDEATVAQRIVRAKQRLRDLGIPFELPDPSEVFDRLPPMLDVLYQAFTEGYVTTTSESGIDRSLCEESLRLIRLLTADSRWTTPEADALRALFCFHVARAPGRLGNDGSLLLLHEQDRSSWDRELLAEAFVFLGRSARGRELSRFHLEAGIAACHAKASSYASTHWGEILDLYDLLRRISPSPVVEVNRALAVAMCRGATAGIDELDSIPERDLLARYPYALATYAELHASLGQLDQARAFLTAALAQRVSPSERALLVRKMNGLTGRT